MFPYFTVEEISSKSGLSSDQVLRLGMAGELIFSVLEHLPRNFEETNEGQSGDGQTVIHTKTNETALVIGNSSKGLQIRYITTEDLINIVTNDAPNRKTLVRSLYETRELDPKKGKWFVNNPMRVALSDVVVTSNEWERFSEGKGRNLKKYVPLALPENITFPWLWKNLPVGMWLKVMLIGASIFSGGIFFAQSSLYGEVTSLLSKPATTDAVPNRVPD